MSAPIATEGRELLDVLSDIFGYTSFREGQEPIMRRLVEGGDALVLMPTGGGKSLCYQVPALVRPGLAVVVSPLVALMYDQVVRLRECGVAAERLNSEMSAVEQAAVVRDVRGGRVKLLYVSPERFAMESFGNLLADVPLAMFAIDEAHCVSQWGHNFRPEYMQIGGVCSRFPGVPRIAVTATASAVTRRDIVQNLRLGDAEVFVSSFDRPNISYSIVPLDNQKRQLLDFMEEHRGESGVVYCGSRNRTAEFAELLRANGFDAFNYHAGLDSAEKTANLDRFLKGEAVVAVATIAFGMGIDKPDVRFVAHLDLPESLEAYYQETGRGGRDGLPAVAWMTYGVGNLKFKRDRIREDDKLSADAKRMSLERLSSLVGMIEGAGCRRAAVLRYFGESHSGRCGGCDRCLNPVETFDGTTPARMALSAAHRTGQIYGAGYLVEILTGADSERVRSKRHDKLPTFGVGRDHSRDWWSHVIQQLYTLDLLFSPPEAKGGLRISEEGRLVLRGEQEIRLVEPPRRKGRDSRRNTPSTKVSIVDGLPEERIELFEALRTWRRDLASGLKIPPYMILPDVSLAGIVSALPDTLDQLEQVSGIGKSKRQRYGMDILKVVSAHRSRPPTVDQIAVAGFGRRG